MHKTIVYGAGYNCEIILPNLLEKGFAVEAIIDSDSTKWGCAISGFGVFTPDIISKSDFDCIVISANTWEPIVNIIKTKYDVPEHMIYIYDIYDKKVMCIKEKRKKNILTNTAYSFAEEIIQNGLIYECWENGEFTGVNRLYVIGEDVHINLISVFLLDVLDKDIKVEKYNSNPIMADEKIIVTTSDYKEVIRKLVSNKIPLRKTLIIPMFDVKESVVKVR